MSDPNSEEGSLGWHTYRCPVCGHTDEVDLEAGVVRSIECSHCGTSLEVVVMHPDAAAAGVTVSTRVQEGP